MKTPTPNQYMFLAIVLRLGFILYAEVQDKYFNLKYTDIDYSVYSDAAKYVLDGGTPYDRHTYRYTPLLAYLMTGNHLLFESFGKVLFSFVDVLTVILMNKLILMSSKTTDTIRSFLINLWLFNPLTISVSTRGNADTIVVFLVYVTLYFLLKKQYKLAALAYGFVVHFKIYPIIYSLPIYFYIDNDQKYGRGSNFLEKLITKHRLQFTLISAGLFFLLLMIFHLIYPGEFLYQTYFYHLIRKDNRHNFSPFFYFMYLYFTNMSPIQSVLTFIPQFLVVSMAGTYFYKDLPFCLLIQTLGFVTFNKVCTAQYFVWWIALLPLGLLNNNFSTFKQKQFVGIGLLWLIIEIQWNIGAYLLEIRGQNAFIYIFISCLIFFLGNIYLTYSLIVNHRLKTFLSVSPIEKLKK